MKVLSILKGKTAIKIRGMTQVAILCWNFLCLFLFLVLHVLKIISDVISTTITDVRNTTITAILGIASDNKRSRSVKQLIHCERLGIKVHIVAFLVAHWT